MGRRTTRTTHNQYLVTALKIVRNLFGLASIQWLALSFAAYLIAMPTELILMLLALTIVTLVSSVVANEIVKSEEHNGQESQKASRR